MTKILQHFLVFQTQSQNGNLRDCQIKNLRVLIKANVSVRLNLVWMNNSRIRAKFSGSYLEQKDPTQGFDDTTLTAETRYSINCTKTNYKILFKPAI